MERIQRILRDFSDGKITVVFDDLDRENEADMIVAVDKLTPEKVNFLVTHAKGLVCASLNQDTALQKGFPLMPTNKGDAYSTAFTLSVDSRSVKTGISPYERYVTAKDLLDPTKTMKDFITPGHLFPLSARRGGLLERRGHTEAAVSLCKWTGLNEVALICEMVKDDGNMLSIEEAKSFASKNRLPFCTIEELVEYQKKLSSNVKKISSAKLKTEFGEFDITVYNELYKNKEHIFLSMGDFRNGVVRIHSECLTGDVFGSKTCDCQSQLHSALRKIAEEGKGAVVYLRQEGRDIGLGEKIKAYNLQQNNGLDTVDANLKLGHKADNRDFHQAAWILKEEGFKTVRLLTNNPQKIDFLKSHGLEVKKERLESKQNPENIRYLKTKKEKLGHSIDI